jgi:alkylation response protein AidB-like acyl-CoA dehydrogenase
MTSTLGDASLEALGAEVRSWLASNWDEDLGMLEWRTRLADAGWACPEWPAGRCGRGLPSDAADRVRRELADAGVVGLPDGVGMRLVAPTILEHATPAMTSRLLRRTVIGELAWCQLFSEPGAGSDLAGLTTSARLDGDEWVVTGQKVWTTSAHHADMGLLLARSDRDVPKHQGITCFAIAMHQPGVEVRPLRQMNGHASFNEVFFDEARVPADQVIGEVHGGWRVALTTLAYERRVAPRTTAPVSDDLVGRARREAGEESRIAAEPYQWYPQRAGRVDLVVPRARALGRSTDPLVRQGVARVRGNELLARLTQRRAAGARASGRPPGPEGSIGKLSSSEVAREAARVHTSIGGASVLLEGRDAPLEGIITEIVVSVPAISIAGGTDEIQRTIIGERVLGLPREPDALRGTAFRDVPTDPSRECDGAAKIPSP